MVLKPPKFSRDVIKGGLIGASMLIPGLSGGTMAIVLNIYDRLMNAVGNLFKDLKSNLIFLFRVAVGGIFGMILFSKLILSLAETYPQPMMSVFIGVVLGSLPALLKKAALTKKRWFNLFFMLPGAVASLSLNFLPSSVFSYSYGLEGFLICVLCGFIIAVALILPGISTSHALLLLGMYEKVWQSVSDMDFLFLLPLLIGCAAGVLLLTRAFSFLLCRFQTQSYCLIAGFVMGSVYEMLPSSPQGFMLCVCILCFVLGFGFIFMVSRHI